MNLRKLILCIIYLLYGATVMAQHKGYTISKAAYEDKVYAIWMAQVIGASMGWQFEHKQASVRDIDDYPKSVLDEYTKNQGARLDDDWYYEMITLKAFQNNGPKLTIEQLGEQWRINRVGSWGAGEWARINLDKGVKAPLSGHPKYNRMWFTMGNQARGELYGMLAPGMPNLAAALSHELGHVSSYAEGTQGGIYVSTIISLGFINNDLRANMREALKCLPKDAPHYKCIDEALKMSAAGKSHKEICNALQDKWHVEYPATNNTVVNMAVIIASLWHGNGDFMKTLNLAFRGGDFVDADNNAAIAGAVVASVYGSKILPKHLVDGVYNRIVGKNVGPVEITPPVDITVTELGKQTVAEGLKVLANNGISIKGDRIYLPSFVIKPRPSENFSPNEFVKYWNPEWTMERAGFGAPGGGHRGIRGGTFLDGDVLSTFPRDETRGVVIYRSINVDSLTQLNVEVAADPGRGWKLSIMCDHDKVFEKVIDGGVALDWPKVSPEGFPPPTEEYFTSAKVRQFQNISISLSKYAGRNIVVRLYDETLVRNKYPGNAYWKNLSITNTRQK